MARGNRMMNGKSEAEWEKIHLPSGHKIMPGCKAEHHVPRKRADRDALWQAAKDYQKTEGVEPFQSLESLTIHADRVLERAGYDGQYHKWTMVMVHNESTRALLASKPFHERLLLLPQCLRKKAICTATFDSMGLLCNACGACHIDPFICEAEHLGYATLVSEGTAAVMSVVQSGGVSAFVGVSCLSTLEKVFSFMAMFKVAAIAVPLLHDSCRYSEVDADWVREYMNERDAGADDLPADQFAYEPENLEALTQFISDQRAEAAAKPVTTG